MLDPNKAVRVFKNLKRDCYTIMQRGRVVASARSVQLKDVEFLVRESGRLRMVREHRRNVHAYAVGMLVDFVRPEETRDLAPLVGSMASYNPYLAGTFVDCATGVPVRSARVAMLHPRGLSYQTGSEDPDTLSVLALAA